MSGAAGAAGAGTGRGAGRGVLFWVSSAWLAAVIAAAAAADQLAPDPNELHTDAAGQGPSWRYPFGVSRIGHDQLARSIHGSRLVLIVMVTSTLVGLVLGGTLGLLAGYAKGRLELVVLVVLDAWIAIPSLMALLAVVTYIGRDVWVIAVAIGLVTVPMFARVTRTATQVVAEADFVRAARMLGARHGRVMAREVLPIVIVPVAAYTFVAMAMALLMEGTLTYLGFGLNLRNVTWGSLVQDGQRELDVRPYLALIPAGLFFATILALNVVGDRLAARYQGVAPARRHRHTRVVEAPDPPGPRSGDDDVLVLDDVRTTIDTAAGPVHAVRGVSLALRRGVTTALVGESGSGKTMLARSVTHWLTLILASAAPECRVMTAGSANVVPLRNVRRVVCCGCAASFSRRGVVFSLSMASFLIRLRK